MRLPLLGDKEKVGENSNLGLPVPVGRQRVVGQGRSVVGKVVGGMYGRFDVGVGVGSAVPART